MSPAAGNDSLPNLLYTAIHVYPFPGLRETKALSPIRRGSGAPVMCPDRYDPFRSRGYKGTCTEGLTSSTVGQAYSVH